VGALILRLAALFLEVAAFVLVATTLDLEVVIAVFSYNGCICVWE
jgi:hypothetical protein